MYATCPHRRHARLQPCPIQSYAVEGALFVSADHTGLVSNSLPIYRVTEEGTVTSTSSDADGAGIIHLVQDPSDPANILAGSRWGSLYRYAGSDSWDVAVGVILAGTESELWYSADGGETFTFIENLLDCVIENGRIQDITIQGGLVYVATSLGVRRFSLAQL